MYRTVRNIFSGQSFGPNVNSTLLVLILKTVDVETIQQFQPICLCIVLYKVVTKTIIIRLRQVMQSLVKQNQSSFIPSCNISYNIVTAQEAIHRMKTMKSRVGWFAVKVDLEKAYDRVRWDFLNDTLHDVGLLSSLIRVIMHCVTSSSIQLLWNGMLTDF